ncbi:D-isomer specific 2-hydroxyacid dehydrogenase family protein [Konateibacter massiliensis]|uniref:D-isomer specific 2-hydroxyacid dehydrogenase family protein n=1 Tax=Konateibacter massiliensis TaxID=2002841 RepID=UPI000C151F81|nr:D-isomer specific 2-hydroxyacid dehydrogenase family protein [Konateibacter massiliensis]
MKIFVYNYRRDDEEEFFELFSKQYQVTLGISEKSPTVESAKLAEGYECVSVITTKIDAAILGKFHEVGVRFISTRTIGFDHIDLEKAKELGIKVGNATYSPSSVADYAIMLILMSLRKMKLILNRTNYQNFALDGVRGRELPTLTVGVLGTGRIGRCVIEHLSGFGCNILAYDLYESEEVKRYAKYVALEEILQSSDIITLHMPATEDNEHLIQAETIRKMKDNVVIVNTARGSLIDTEALIEGLESGKIGAAALDVVENESRLFYKDCSTRVIGNHELLLLKSYPNVILTPHTAFYTDQAVSDMVENSIKSCCLFLQGEKNPWEVA